MILLTRSMYNLWACTPVRTPATSRFGVDPVVLCASWSLGTTHHGVTRLCEQCVASLITQCFCACQLYELDFRLMHVTGNVNGMACTMWHDHIALPGWLHVQDRVLYTHQWWQEPGHTFLHLMGEHAIYQVLILHQRCCSAKGTPTQRPSACAHALQGIKQGVVCVNSSCSTMHSTAL